jgi:hypothetical protein
MLREQWATFKSGDIFLGDKGFCSYFDVSSLKDRGVDSVSTLARRIPVIETESAKVLDENDWLIQWKRPVRNKNSSYAQSNCEELTETLMLRQIKVNIHQPGFRTKGLYIITTLLDSKVYKADDLADLYFTALGYWTVLSRYKNNDGHGYFALQKSRHDTQGNSHAFDRL